ncbi:MAG TPA: preprotein translocase subunit SecG [Usitatibacteraceae bacterium]
MANIILVLHVILAVSIIILVLLQHGKGADMGAAFGSGSAGSLFGSSGAANFLSRSTAVCATLFFVTSLGLTYYHAPKTGVGVMDGVMKNAPVSAPAAEPAKGAADSIPAPAAPAAGSDTPAKSQEIPK